MTYELQAEIRAKHIRKLIVAAMRSGARFDGGHNSRGYWMTATKPAQIRTPKPVVIFERQNFERMNYFLGFIRETRKRLPFGEKAMKVAA